MDLKEEKSSGKNNAQSEQTAAPAYIKMDYSLKTPEERLAKVNEIIENTPPEKLRTVYLEKLADYLIFPETVKERKNKYPVLTENRMVSVNRRETSFEGLIGKLENGEDGLYNMINQDKNTLLSPKICITQEDINTIPGLKELREAITQVEKQAAKATGKKKFSLINQLKELRKDQYVLKNSFRKPIYSHGTIKTLTNLNLEEEITIDENYHLHSTAPLNLYTQAHVVALLCNYSKLKMETWDKFDSDMRWLLIDLEATIDAALKERFPLLYDLLIYKIDGKQNVEIQQLLEEKYGIKHSIEYISSLWRNKIPKLIVEQAEKNYLEWYFTVVEKGNWKRCTRCGQIKLAINKYFSKNNASKDGCYSICKNCRNKK